MGRTFPTALLFEASNIEGLVELLLEPDHHPAVGPFKRALLKDGIPAASFGVADIQAEFDRLRAAGHTYTITAV